MVALQIRDVPDDVRQVLVEAARARGQSLQAYLLALVAEEAGRAANVALMRTFRSEPEDIAVDRADILEEIDRGRERALSHREGDTER